MWWEPHFCVQAMADLGATETFQPGHWQEGWDETFKCLFHREVLFFLATFPILHQEISLFSVSFFPSAPVKDLLDLDFPKRTWWVHGFLLLFCPCTTLGLLPTLPKLCWSMRKAEHMVFALHFWYHKADPRDLTLNCVPTSSIRSSEEQPVLSLQYQPVTLSQDIWWYSSRVLLRPHKFSVILFCTTQLHNQSEHSVDVWAHADAQVCGFTFRFSTHTLCQRMWQVCGSLALAFYNYKALPCN